MSQRRCPCVIPSPTEQEVAVLPGAEPHSAMRVRVEPCCDGYVRLEQLAYSADLGWYPQKSFCIPRELVRTLSDELRKADCLFPRSAPADGPESLKFQPRLPTDDDGPTLGRANA